MFFKVVIIVGNKLTAVNASEDTIRTDAFVSYLFQEVMRLQIGDHVYNNDRTIIIIRIG